MLYSKSSRKMTAENLHTKEIESIPRYLYIGLVGPVGAGKSTIGDLMTQFLSVPSYPVTKFEERYDENPFLTDFYASPKEFSFKSQVFFLESKVRQLKVVSEDLARGSVVVDPALEMDRIFARTQAMMGWMSEGELSTYEALHDSLKDQQGIIDPDLYIVVNAPADIIRQRVKERGRDFELRLLSEQPEYFDRLCDQVDSYAKSIKTIPVINIDSQRRDFVNTPHGRWDAMSEIMAWTGYYFRDNHRNSSKESKLIIPSFL